MFWDKLNFRFLFIPIDDTDYMLQGIEGAQSFTHIRPENMTDSSNISNIILGFESETVFSAGQRKILWASVFLLWLFWAGSVEGHRGCNYDGREKEEMVHVTVREKRKRRRGPWERFKRTCTHVCSL